jgi:hypothetical protein
MRKQQRSLKWTVAAVAVIACGFVIGGARTAGAQTAADLRAGLYTDAEGVGVGGGVLTPIGHDQRWYANPNVEAAFADRRNVYSVNGDVRYDLPVQGQVSCWLGAGPAVVVRDPDFGNSSTDLGLNLLAGVGGKRGQVRPYGQLKGVVSDNSEVAVMAGIRF